MAEFTFYTCKGGDRWDQISYNAYGNVAYMNEIIEANPDIPVDVDIPGGTIIKVPIKTFATTNVDSLPPWKR